MPGSWGDVAAMSRTGAGKFSAAVVAVALISFAALPVAANAATAEFNQGSLDFPDTLVGVSSPDQQVLLKNDGPDKLGVGGVSIGGTDSSDFAVTVDNCTGVVLAEGESCELRVAFTPSDTGPRSAELDLKHSGDNSPATTTLSGYGRHSELTVSPDQLDFPATTVGYQGGQQQVTAKNTGDVPVSINNVFIDGTNPSDFNQNGNCGGQLYPGQGCTINVNFWPTGAGSRDATLHLISDEPRGDQTVALTGTGADPALTFEPASYDFGLQRVNSGSAQTNLQVRNTGVAAVQVNSIDIVGPDSGNFWTGFSSCWGTTLQPNDTCTVQVNFGPNNPTDYAAQLRVSVNGYQFTADLTGRGGQANVVGSPNPADFGSATAGQAGLTRTITLTNNGELPGGFFVAVVSGGDVASFKLIHENCTGHPLDPAASCTAEVRFQPDSPGAKVAQLSFFGDQDGGAQVNLTGVGLDSQASLTPTSHDFGRQAVDSTSRSQTFEVSNDGDGDMRLNGASIVGSDADQYRLSADDCTDVVLASGERCAVQVKFAPDSRGDADRPAADQRRRWFGQLLTRRDRRREDERRRPLPVAKGAASAGRPSRRRQGHVPSGLRMQAQGERHPAHGRPARQGGPARGRRSAQDPADHRRRRHPSAPSPAHQGGAHRGSGRRAPQA